MTCKKITEFGFKCPKLEQNCGCKSPAALCYKPLNSDEILIVLNNLISENNTAEMPETTLEKIKIIKNFIQNYLYNIDSVTAETIINNNVKSLFGLRSVDVVPLIKLHREIYKKYSENKETRRETGTELPDWYEQTERGGLRFLPGVLADHLTKTVDAFYGASSFFFYKDGVYEMQEDLAAQAKVREHLIPRHATMTAISDATGQWKMQIRKSVREINCNPFVINVKNGLLNILDDSFKPHTPQYFSTVQINANYTMPQELPAHTNCPQFLEFLESILPKTELPLIQEIFGYLLIPVNKAQKSFVFVGAANAGKSTLLAVAQEILLGSENVSNIPWQALSDRFNKAELFGKLANIFADLPSKSVDDGGIFKSITGEDSITAERKNRDPFSFRPYARLLFSCNDMPKNYSDRSDGFYRRLIIIRFDKSVPKNRRDPNLRERIAAERDGILTWALEGLKRLIANDYLFSETDRTRDEVTRYKIECNSALAFVNEMCEIKDEAFFPREDLYSRYKDFCHQNGYKPLSQSNFNKDIESNFSSVKRGQDRASRRKVWRGITHIEGGLE